MLTETPGATDTTSLYDFGTPDDGYLVKFILPTVVALLGLVEFFMAAGLLVYVYSTTDKVTCSALFCNSALGAGACPRAAATTGMTDRVSSWRFLT